EAAMAFEKSMSNVSTLLDTTTEDMEAMKNEVLDMSTRVPVAMDDLTAALYDVRSAGISAASAMDVLETSAVLGVAGLGTTKEATNLLTTAINAFGLQGRSSKEVADVLFKTVKAGKTDIAKLSEAFGKMAGNAKAANVSFEDAQAATAALTALTGKTSEAQNALAQVFLELTIAGGKLDKALQENGTGLIELNELIGDKGLVGGMKAAMEAAGLTEVEFKNLFSSAEGGTAVYQLLTDAYDANAGALNNMTDGANMLDEAVKKQNETYAAQYTLLKNQLNQQLIKLGVELLPLIKKGIEDGILIVKEWKSWFDSLADTLGTVIFKLQQAWDWLKKVNKKATDFFTGGEGGMKYVPFFQHGGTVPGAPTQAVPIIAHGGEQVIPANQTKRGAGGGVAITINNPIVRSDDDLDRITRQVEKVFRGVFLNNKVAF
ncbi:phage tail tape measure protein, partial [Candidatus Parcubacteria bacterium]|nr:phage tail tape measure protein [Candidatus Parcubacteria bacterium]